MLHLRWYHKNKLIVSKKGDVKNFRGEEGGEARDGELGLAEPFVMAGVFGMSGASILDIPFGTAGSSVLGVSFGD